MSKIKVNEIDSRSGTTVTVTTGKTVSVPAGATLDVAGTQTVTGAQTNTGTLDISGATVTLPTTLPATIGTNITQLPAANLTGQVPAASLGNVDLAGINNDIALLALKTQANGNLARYNLVDQSVDSFEDTSGINTGTSSGELRDSTGKYFVGATTGPATVSGNYDSTGVDGAYTWYKWTTVRSDGSYTTDSPQDYEYLVVAGGGAGGRIDYTPVGGAGGGGAGGYRTATGFPVAATTISGITVGAGGTAVTSGYGHVGDKGGDSVFSTITSTGGGAGGHSANPNSYNAGQTGGSAGGGGARGSGTVSTAGNEGGFSPVEGYAGGAGSTGDNGGGGGGASAVGADAPPGSADGGNGGDGRQSSIDGAATWRGGGGGGGCQAGGGDAGDGGQGGGGNGEPGPAPQAQSGTANTGGGGGGNGSAGDGGNGGSGIVIIRRSTLADVPGGNMTLISNAITAQTAPTKADVVITYTNGQAGTAIPNTDLTASVSMDGGSTYTDITNLAAVGTTAGQTILTSNDITLTSTSGTSMVWKIITTAQSAGAKETRIHGISLGWS